MTPWSTLAISGALFSAAVAAHLLVCNFTGGNRFMLKGLLTGFAFLIIAAVWEHGTGAVDFVSFYLVITLWLTYLMFFVNLLNSVTLKMLSRLAEEPSGAMTEAGFQSIFNEETGIKTRLEDLRSNGFLKPSGETISLTKKTGLLLKIVFLIRKVFFINIVG